MSGRKALLYVLVALVVFSAGGAVLVMRDEQTSPRPAVRATLWEGEAAPSPAVAKRPRQRPGPPKGFSPAPGSPVFRVRIPAIDLDEVVVEGVRAEDLIEGPGHYPECSKAFAAPFCSRFPAVYPGERGRVIVSGHRTTYGAPFWSLDALRRGDRVIVETRWGRFVYRVTRQTIVDADRSGSVVERGRKAEIMFTTCHPRFSAAQRLLVFAELETA